MTNASKTKGNNAERELARIMIDKFGGSWLRTPTSGAITGKSNNWRAKTMSKSQLLNATNDITPPDEYSKCALESKFYKELDFHNLYRGKGCTTLNGWIDQVKESGINMDESFPMICIKINRLGWFCCLWFEKIKTLNLSDINHTVYNYNGEKFIITDLLDFLDKFNQELRNFFS